MFVSTGTIHLKIEGEKIENVFFVPDNIYCVKHQGKDYAVFFPKESSRKAKVVLIKECLNSVELTLDISNCKMNTALLDAVTERSKVDVEVNSNLKVISITVPALPVK